MDTSLERIAFDMIKELGLATKTQPSSATEQSKIKDIDKVVELYQYALEKIKPAQNPNQQA